MRTISLFLFQLFICSTLLATAGLDIGSLKQTAETQTGEPLVNTLNQIALYYLQQDSMLAAKSYIERASLLASDLNYLKGMADAADNKGLTFQGRYDYTNAMKRFVEALKIRNNIQDEAGIATSKNNIGKLFFLQEDYDQAEENLVEALQKRRKMKDVAGAAETSKNLGDVYLAKKIYGKAKEAFREAMELKLEVEDVEGAAKIANEIGKIASDLGDYEGALLYYQTSLDLHTSMEDMSKIATDFSNMTQAFIEQKAWEDALSVNENAEGIRKNLNDEFGLAETYKNAGIIYAGIGDKATAETNLKSSLEYLKKTGERPGTQLIYKDIALAYEALGNFEAAYKSHKAYANARDFLYNEEKSKALLDLTTKYESEFAAEQQQQQIEKLELQQANAQKFRYVLLAIIALIGLLLLNVFINYKRKQKDNELLLAKNEEIQRQKDEIDRQNISLEEKNASLDVLNQKLVHEMAERESIEKSSFARDRFLATMSHEMRTPMNIIIGLTHLLLEENPREDQVEHLRTLQFSANNLVVFINDILDFSKIEAGKLTLESREFKLQKLVKEIEARFVQPAREKHNELNFQFDSKLPEILVGDPTRLNQILTNIVSTSNNYTSKGQIDVSIKLHELHQKEATLLLTVQDNGQGLEPEKIQEMFRQFNRNTGDIFEGYSSSDLALAITRRLVDLQNGKIEVSSEKGKGNLFIVYLPFKLAENSAKKRQKKSMDSFTHLAGNRILVVEDNKINQLVVAKMLRKLGMEVQTADNGLEALDALAEKNFNLILMDIQMPKMDGYRTTAEIRKMPDPKKRDLPIIALTASAFLTEKEKAKLFGMNDHVGKPFGPEDLLEKISKCLGIHQMV